MAFAPSQAQTNPTFQVGDRVTWRELSRVGRVVAVDTTTYPGEPWAKVTGVWASTLHNEQWVPWDQLKPAP
jgi:hypothetical protein